MSLEIVVGWTYLKHLNKGNGKVEVRQIAAYQRKREHEADWDDSSEVQAAGHGDVLAGVESVGEASHYLGHEGAEEHVP